MIVCIWVVSANGDRQKYSVKVSHLSTPEEVIAEAIRRRTRKMNMTVDQQDQCVQEYQSSYVLKVCGCDQFLLEQFPISQYKVSSAANGFGSDNHLVSVVVIIHVLNCTCSYRGISFYLEQKFISYLQYMLYN